MTNNWMGRIGLLLAIAGALAAQTGGGATLVGTVRDSTGATVAGAKLTVVNVATQFVAENTTSAEGTYYVPYLAPGLWWMQCFVTKSWRPVGERFMLSFRLDGHNLPHKNPNLSAPNTDYNLNNTNAWGRYTGVVGDFSNFGTGQANVQMSIRAEF